MIAQKVLFKGRVQGVGFRYTAKQLALGFDIVGTVANLPDGTVELCLMGEEDEVEDYLQEIVEESELSALIKEHLILEIDPMRNCQGFTIIS